MRLGRGAELRVDDAGLDHGQAIVAIDAEDAVEASQDKEHRSHVRQRAARESCPRPAGHERDIERGEETYDGDQFFPRARQHNEIRNATMSGEAVHRVSHALRARCTDVALTDNRGEIASKVGKRGHAIY